MAAAAERVDITPIDCERPVVARKRLLVTRELGEQVAAIEMGLGEIRLQRQGPVVAGDRIVMTAELMQGGAEIEPVAGRIGLQVDRALVARDRVRDAAELRQRAPAIAVGVGKIRLLDDRVIEARQRFLRSAEPAQGHAEEIMRARLARVARQRPPRHLDPVGELAPLAGNHRQVVKRLGMIGLVPQHLLIAARGIGERP